MVKEYFGTFAFPFKWEVVSTGFWVKYPNPYSSHVLSEDVISRHITEQNVLVTRKLLVKERNFHLPKWASQYVKNYKHVYVIEETFVDPNKHVLTSYTRNFSLNSLMTVIEKCEYTKDPNDSERTICHKQAKFCSPLLFGVGTAIEQFAVNRFKKNADRASKGLQWILEKFQLN